MKKQYIAITILAAQVLFSCISQDPVIIYVNSYHPGYPPSDEIQVGILNGLPESDFDLRVFYLDSKRQPLVGVQELRADSIARIILEEQPSAVIVSDDNAVKYLAEPYLNASSIPVVFCGVNWSAEQYGLDRSNITGMLEVLPLRECITLLKKEFPNTATLTILSENSLSEQNNTLLLDTLYRNLGLEPVYLLVDTFEEWKVAFKRANETSEAIYLPTNGAISGWNLEEAWVFVEEHINKPVFTCDDFMMEYCLFGLTKVPREQGDWAAGAVMSILSGTSPEDIPVTSNKLTVPYFNVRLSGFSGLMQDSEWGKKANKVD
jgi:ABC-type uncharacterized transport system substrate-binding protein